jgi:preprotein translocase subunit YajC
MSNKRTPSAHERQMRFLTILFSALLVIIMVVVMWLLNRPQY